MSTCWGKPIDSVFDFISILPGVISAHRYRPYGEIVESNMYLAEDQILRSELVAKTKGTWLPTYVKSIIASIDVNFVGG
ncbi:Chitin synthase, class 1 [Linnemannia gamsii]|uniref:Chitin synthase n=1 Tax=Linnemannia gamsii TaxID=64522 RepID=A0ABQ7K9Y7_9FUNG|nr:Chitin synthase, class 1 [Linnemannia gamsii]